MSEEKSKEAKAQDIFAKHDKSNDVFGGPSRTYGKDIFVRDPGPDPRPTKHFRIVSEDGLSHNTKVYFGDEEVKGVTNININIDADSVPLMATLTILEPVCDIKFKAEGVMVVEHEYSKLLANQKSFNQDGAA